MKHLILATITILSALSAKAEDYSKHYQNLPVELKQVVEFTIPKYTVSIADFGGVGDGATLNTEAFRKAISALTKKGGGRLVVPQGVWLTGPIALKDNIELHVERNAIVLFSPDKSLFLDAEGKSSRCEPGIKALKKKNIAITGEGIIDGNGAQWRPVKRSKVSDVEWKRFAAIGGVERQNGQLWYPWNVKAGYKNIGETPDAQEKRRQDLVRLTDCENILIKGVTFQNSPRFHVHPCNSRNIIIDGITVRCPWNAQNGDAIDLSDCQQALIVNSTVDAGDDGICMKSGKAKPAALVNGCEDILIEDNTVFHAHGGFVIGSEDITGMKRIVVRRCRFSGTDTGLRFKSGMGRGGKTEDIYISDIVMNDITDEAIVFQCDYVDRPAGSEGKTAKKAGCEFVPEFTDIHISNVVCRGAKTAIKAKGIEGLDCIHDINISSSTIVYTSTGKDIDENTAKVNLVNVNFVEDKAE
ncbi:MAG: glycoside hydrolase family 28 protein [Prevotella sp.]